MNTGGLVPYITDAHLDRLDPYDRELIQGELEKVAGGSLEHQENIQPRRVESIMSILGVTPVWGREFQKVYRLNINERVLVFAVVPDPESDGVPPEVLTREFIDCTSIPDLLEKMNAWAKGVRDLDGREAVIYPEDHPEENAVGFFAPDANRVWLLSGPQAVEDIKAENNGGWAQVLHLIQSNMGRVELAQRVAQGLLISVEEFQAQWEKLTGEVPAPDGRGKNEIIIDLMSGQLADRYKARYLRPKGDQ